MDGALLREYYKELGVSEGKVVYLTSDISKVLTNRHYDKYNLLQAHLEALLDLLGASGTLVVPTASTYLCNTPIVFDPQLTPSRNMGAFSEFVRTKDESIRSFHPFWSVAAIGAQAMSLTQCISRHGFGHNSIWTRLLQADALGVHVGVHPTRSFSIVHHAELVAGAPYRYTKEFAQPVKRGQLVKTELFYLFSCYQGIDLIRDRNRKIFKYFSSNIAITEVVFGSGKSWSYALTDFFSNAVNYLAEDLYGWLETEPNDRPWTK